jgi:hypothetical protein
MCFPLAACRFHLLLVCGLIACAGGCGDRSISQQADDPVGVAPPRPGATVVETSRIAPAGSKVAVARPTAIRLANVTNETGIGFCHTDGNCGKFYLVEAAASGLATFDYDRDGLIDVYFLSGVPLPGAGPDAPPGGNALYRNLGGFRFEDVTAKAGVGAGGFGLGVAAADYDNDGDQDLYVSNFGPNVLYRNNGDGTFTNVAATAGVDDGDQFGAGVSFLDIENDGDLDLYVANYTKLDLQNQKERTFLGIPVYAGPLDFEPIPHSLYRNRGDGTFEDVSEPSGIRAHPGLGMGTVCADFDDDGDTDIFVANDESPNFCFQNDGAGNFTEIASRAGLATNAHGKWVGNMGVDAADYDQDGRFDLFTTTYQREVPLLLHNLGGGMFEDIAARAAETKRCYNNSKWGCGFADFDNDGRKDLFVGIGHLQVNIEQYDKTSAYAATPMLLWNNGQGRFLDVSDSCGDGFKVMCVARGVALEDLDNDGRIDVVISNSRRPPVVLRNETQTAHHWLELELRGARANRDAVGARVRVTAGDLVQLDEVHSGRGYQSHFGSRLHFGVGERSRIDKIEVRWPGGFQESWTNVAVDQILPLTEGAGTADLK